MKEDIVSGSVCLFERLSPIRQRFDITSAYLLEDFFRLGLGILSRERAIMGSFEH